ncbi:MAG TPA: hypothetical protein VE377_05390 [Candidatus Dormibacteraeota bacterium]|nr:hypothetical protein [Candidatus Dormibacteraeota bacterium]
MSEKISEMITWRNLVLIVVLGAAWQVQAQNAKTPYPSMAALDQYLIADRNAEITMARSAAPEAISREAKILVLGRHGYETAVEGKNGFVCIVERGWMGPADAREFWNPKIRGPVCFNPPAARSVLPITYKRTEMVLAGRTKAEIIEGNKAAFEKGELPALEPGAMSYMMSKEAYLTDDDDHNVAHLMFYTPLMDGTVWGADLHNSPVMLNPQFKGAQPIDVFVVPVGRWSDGTAAPVM